MGRVTAAEKLTAGIWLICRALNFPPIADIRQIGHLRLDTSYLPVNIFAVKPTPRSSADQNTMYLNIRKIYLTRGMTDLLVTFFSHSGGVLVGLAMQSLLAWTLGAEGRGEYAICLIFSSLGTVFFLLGTDWSVSYYISTGKYPRNSIISFAVVYFCLAVCIALLVLPLITGLKIAFFVKVSGQALNSTIVWTVSLIALLYCNSILSGMREFNLLAKLTLSKVTMTLILSFILLMSTHLEIRAPIIADTISCFCGAFITFFLLVKKFNYRWEWPHHRFTCKLLKYAVRVFTGTIGMIANARIGTILLAFYVDKRSLGFFALSMSFLSQLISISDITARIIQPRIAASQNGRCDLVTLCSRLIGILVLLIGVLLIISSNFWIPVLFSSEFLPIISIIVILVPGIWFRVIGKILYPYFNGIDRPEIVSISTLINLISNFVILLVLVKPYGLKGAAWATTISYSLSTAYVICKYVKISGCSLLELLVLRKKDLSVLKNQFLKF